VKLRKKPHKRRHTVIGLILLAITCVLGVELAVCRVADPELFRTITTPVVETVKLAGSAVRTAGHAIGVVGEAFGSVFDLLIEGARPRPTEAPDSQLAREPMFLTTEPIADPVITELRSENGLEILTGGVVKLVYFNQADPTWAEEPYGTDQIGGYGCGPSAMAMAVSSLTDTVVDPAEMAQWAADNGHWASGSGSYLSVVEGAAAAWGLGAVSFHDRSVSGLVDTLLTGEIMVALMGPGHFTQGGHFILLHGVTLSGGVLVADPNSRERSLTVWDPALLLEELSTSTANGGPLWLITEPSGS